MSRQEKVPERRRPLPAAVEFGIGEGDIYELIRREREARSSGEKSRILSEPPSDLRLAVQFHRRDARLPRV